MVATAGLPTQKSATPAAPARQATPVESMNTSVKDSISAELAVACSNIDSILSLAAGLIPAAIGDKIQQVFSELSARQAAISSGEPSPNLPAVTRDLLLIKERASDLAERSRLVRDALAAEVITK